MGIKTVPKSRRGLKNGTIQLDFNDYVIRTTKIDSRAERKKTHFDSHHTEKRLRLFLLQENYITMLH